jgi:hypothetical protein
VSFRFIESFAFGIGATELYDELACLCKHEVFDMCSMVACGGVEV